MVNQVRTTLLNLPAWTGPVPPPGEEYVPATFAPKTPPPALAPALALLYGDGADRAGMNLTLARLLAYLHGSQFAPDLTAADPRVTYDPARPGAVFGALGPAVVAGGPVAGWVGGRGFPAPGRAFGQWTVAATGTGYALVTPADTGAATEVPVVPQALGDGVPLPGSLLTVVLPHAVPATWTVSLLVPPANTFAALAGLSPAVQLFRPENGAREAFWYDAWLSNGAAWYRAGAAALALAARLTELTS